MSKARTTLYYNGTTIDLGDYEHDPLIDLRSEGELMLNLCDGRTLIFVTGPGISIAFETTPEKRSVPSRVR